MLQTSRFETMLHLTVWSGLQPRAVYEKITTMGFFIIYFTTIAARYFHALLLLVSVTSQINAQTKTEVEERYIDWKWMLKKYLESMMLSLSSD